MIKRIWHGWTAPERADAYETLLRDTVFPGIEAMRMPGYRGIELMRRSLADEVEFVTAMSFDSLDSVVAFQGEDYERAYVPAEARRLLLRWDDRSAHYEVQVGRPAG